MIRRADFCFVHIRRLCWQYESDGTPPCAGNGFWKNTQGRVFFLKHLASGTLQEYPFYEIIRTGSSGNLKGCAGHAPDRLRRMRGRRRTFVTRVKNKRLFDAAPHGTTHQKKYSDSGVRCCRVIAGCLLLSKQAAVAGFARARRGLPVPSQAWFCTQGGWQDERGPRDVRRRAVPAVKQVLQA